MGWRVDQNYEDSRKLEHQAWLSSLPLMERIRWQSFQVIRLAIFGLIVGGVIYMLMTK